MELASLAGAQILQVMAGRPRLSTSHSRSAALHSVPSADGSTRLADGCSGHADTVNPGSPCAAGGSDLRDHAVRLRDGRGRHGLRRGCEGQGKAGKCNQPDHFSSSLWAVGTSRLVPKLRGCRTSAGYDFLISSLSASERDGSPPCGRRERLGGKCCHSHKKDSCSQHSRRMDSRSRHIRRMDSYCRNTSHSRSQFRKTVRTVRCTPDSHSRRNTRQRRNQQHPQRLRKLYCEPRGDRTVAARPQRSRVSAVGLSGHQRRRSIASQSFTTIEVRMALQPVTRHHR